MTRRQQLVDIMIQSQGWLKGQELAMLLGVSDRTIRADIEKLNQQYPGCIQSHHHKGYHLQATPGDDAPIHSKDKIIPKTHEERLHYLLKQLLAGNRPVRLLDLAQEVYVSPQTMSLTWQHVVQLIGRYPELHLCQQEEGWQLIGSEFQKRRLYRELLMSELQGDFLNLDKVIAMYIDFDMAWVADYFQYLLDEADYQVRPASLPLLLLHIGIVVQRILAGQFLYDPQLDVHLGIREEQLAQDFLSGVSQHFACHIPSSECYSIGRLLEGYRTLNYVERWVSHQGSPLDLGALLEDLGHYLEEVTSLDFTSDPDFIMRLHLHIQGLIERLRYKVELPNLFLQDMKRQYPLVFDLAVSVSTWLGSKLGVGLSEAEIGLIAVHIGSSYSRLEVPCRLRAIILAPHAYPLVQSSVERLHDNFRHRLEIVAQYDYFSESHILHHSVDLVISFIPLARGLDVPVIQVSTFFHEEDELTLIGLLNHLEKRKTDLQLSLRLGDFLNDRFFYQALKAQSKEDVLRQMAQDLKVTGYVTDGFLSSVLEREALSSTDFDYALAIPHPLGAYSQQSVLSIAILDEAIMWGRFPVKLVILLALNETDWSFTQLFFKWLGQCLARPQQLKALLDAHSCADFIQAVLLEADTQ